MAPLGLTGQTLLHYRILEKIGEGGMGAVYKAIDTHLDRPVAVKVLPADKVADAERKSRFVQEAKAASALRHSNIVVIHDIASDRGLDFIVMELLEGKSLDELVGRKGLKLNDALGLAVQIADGLAKAHAAGIIHRDIKPTNVMVTADGLVKILDFGLAKLTEEVPGGEGGPTMTLGREERPRTEEGYIVGTAAYMSPEQAEGKKVDARSDIFSFGAVLYEMLTGRRAFGRDSQMKTLAAVLNEEPKPASAVSEAVPAELERILARCLRKDPQRRWQTMSDLKVALQDLKEDSESGKLQAAAPAGRGKRRLFMPLVVAAGVVAAAALVLRFVVLKPAGPVEYEITPLTFDSGFTGFPTLPTDGSFMAYASDREDGKDLDIWVRHLSGGQPRLLTDHPATDWFPSFSPDGSQIVFRSERDGGGLYLVDALGGEARRIHAKGSVPKFSLDGRWIVFVVVPPSLEGPLYRLYLVPATGGEARPFHPELCPTYIGQGGPLLWSPDSGHVIFRGRRVDDPGSSDWWVAPVGPGQPVRTRAVDNLDLSIVHYPVGWLGDDVYFASGTTIEGVNLFRTRIDPRSFAIKGPAVPITTGPGMKIYASVTRDGRVVFTEMTASISTWGIAAKSDDGTASGSPERLTQDLMQKFSPAISRDGSKAAFIAFGGVQAAKIEVRLKDLRTGRETSIPMRSINLDGAVLSPDGSRLAYREWVEGKLKTFVLEPGASAGREVCEGSTLVDFFPGNDAAVIKGASGRLEKLDLTTGKAVLLLDPGGETMGRSSLSPDGRWLAWLGGGPDGRVTLRVSPVDGPADDAREPVTLSVADHYLGSPAWSPNGRWLYYLSESTGRTALVARELDVRTKRPVGAEREVYVSPSSRFMLNFPMGNGAVAVAADRILFTVTEVSANIYQAAPKKR
ncbi:MAG TPA: protein kinase [Candidatus Aminicenantes bacterium]|nr:protein kinase [Candidatus Aminicenantes bacterium]